MVWYAAAILLVACYPNTFAVWQGISFRLGPTGAAILPFAATATVFLGAIIYIAHRQISPGRSALSSNRRGQLYVAAGAMIAVAGIFATDPNFPAKRIHIPQYFVLALVIHRALSFDLPTQWIFPGAVLLTAILGIHDELIQGLLPTRTFGLRDIGVNALGALSGGVVGAGLSLFATPVIKDFPIPNNLTRMGIGAVVIGLVLMLAPLEYFRDTPVPVWTTLPLFAGGFALSLLSWRDPFSRTRPYAAFILITMTLPVYLLSTHANTIDFH